MAIPASVIAHHNQLAADHRKDDAARLMLAQLEILTKALETIIGTAPDTEPEEEAYDDMESYSNGWDCAAWTAARHAREGLIAAIAPYAPLTHTQLQVARAGNSRLAFSITSETAAWVLRIRAILEGRVDA